MKFHEADSAKGRYNMILVRDLWTTLVINLKLSDQVIEVDNGLLKGSTATMLDLSMC